MPRDVFHFDPQVLEIQRDAVSENVHDAVPENAGRQQMQGEFSLFVDDGMTRVPAALTADDDIIFRGEQVDHAAFAFIPPS